MFNKIGEKIRSSFGCCSFSSRGLKDKVGKLLGRIVSWIRNPSKSTEAQKTDRVARSSLEEERIPLIVAVNGRSFKEMTGEELDHLHRSCEDELMLDFSRSSNYYSGVANPAAVQLVFQACYRERMLRVVGS